jgi:long-chain acyl-CoA synthetase
MLTTPQIFLAGAELGAYVTLLNYGYTAQELVAALNVSRCNILIATLKSSRYNYQSALECLKQEVTSLEHIVILPDIGRRDVQLPAGSDFRPYQDVLAGRRAGNPSTRPAGSPEDILNLQFTSGSTGLPKAAALTQYGITNSARYLAMRMEVTPQDRLLVPVPLFHAFGLIMGQCLRTLGAHGC